LRIEGSRVVTGESVTSADVVILYNVASTGLAATTGDISVNVDGIPYGTAQYSGTPGVFKVTLTSEQLGLGAGELPEKEYWISASVTDGGDTYTAEDPRAIIVVKQQKALPETDFFVIALFVLLALFLMRTQSRGKARKK